MPKLARKSLYRSACILLLALVWPCLGSGAPILDGAALYERHCASCHRPLAKTLMFDRSHSRILSAVERFAVMRPLRTLSVAEIEAIAAALVSPAEARR